MRRALMALLVGVLVGPVSYALEPVEAPAEGNALICCSTPRNDLVLDL